MTAPRIDVARTGDRSGFLVASMPPPPGEWAGERLVVGDVYRNSPDGEPENWRAWLWPLAGGALAVTQSCAAVDAPSPEQLEARLRGRADRDGIWWGDGA